jgi:predicted ATPase
VSDIPGYSSCIRETIAAIMAVLIKRLPPNGQDVLMVASCLGLEIPVQVLSAYFETTTWHQQGVFTSSSSTPSAIVGNSDYTKDENHKVIHTLGSAVDAGILSLSSTKKSYKWSHDKVFHAAYPLTVPDTQQDLLHWRLGTLLLDMSSSHPAEDWMVYILACQFITAKLSSRLDCTSPSTEDERGVLRVNLASLNLKAAKLSIAKSAFYPVADLLCAGVAHLDETTRWTHQ